MEMKMMKNEISVILKRFYENGKETLGYLYVLDDKKLIGAFNTLELPDLCNKSNVSCIPTGVYSCHKREATANINYRHVLIDNVPYRSGICIHVANYYTQIRGCIVVGDSFSDINNDGILDITNSRTSFNRLMDLLPDKFKLHIIKE